MRQSMLKRIVPFLLVLCCIAPPALADFSLFAKDADNGDFYQLNFTVDAQGDAEFSSIGLVTSCDEIENLTDIDALEFRHGKFHVIRSNSTNGSRLITVDKSGRQLFIGDWETGAYRVESMSTDEDGVTWVSFSSLYSNLPDCIAPIDLSDGSFDLSSKLCTSDDEDVNDFQGFDFDLYGDGTAYGITQDDGNNGHFHTIEPQVTTFTWDELRDLTTPNGNIAISNTTGHIIAIHNDNPTKIYELAFDSTTVTATLLHTLTGGPTLSDLADTVELNLFCDLDDDATLNSSDDVGAMDDDYCEIEGTFTLDGWTVADGGTAELVAGDSIILKPGTVINAGDIGAFKGTVDSGECPIVSPVCDFTI